MKEKIKAEEGRAKVLKELEAMRGELVEARKMTEVDTKQMAAAKVEAEEALDNFKVSAAGLS